MRDQPQRNRADYWPRFSFEKGHKLKKRNCRMQTLQKLYSHEPAFD